MVMKYNRTFQLPWSDSDSSDDVWWKDCSSFKDREVVVTEKLDGENTTIYHGGNCHARSVDSRHHDSRSWIKSLASQIGYSIPKNYRICGENMYAYHSIFYKELPSYFLVFGIYDENNNCISWKDTEEMCEMLNLHTVPVLYRGIWDEKKIRSLWDGKGSFPTFSKNEDNQDFVESDAEGYVVRIADGFHYSEFRDNCAKYVRANHVQSSTHWMSEAITPNLLKNNQKNS